MLPIEFIILINYFYFVNSFPQKAQAAKAKKAAAAAAAASQQQNNNNGAAQNLSTTGMGANASSIVDVKPNIANLQQAINGPNKTAGGTSSNITSTLMNGTIKQEPLHQHMQTTQSQPPPLHPTSSNSAMILQQQKQQQQQQVVGGGSNQQPSAGSVNNQPQSSTIPIVAALDPNRIMPVNVS